jgi:hypothetical protein
MNPELRREDGTGLEYSLRVIGADKHERGLSSRIDGWTGSCRHLQDAASAGWRALMAGKADPSLDIAEVLVIGRFGYGAGYGRAGPAPALGEDALRQTRRHPGISRSGPDAARAPARVPPEGALMSTKATNAGRAVAG